MNLWDIWLRDNLEHLACKLFLTCCFTLPFLCCCYFPIEVIVLLLDTCCHGAGWPPGTGSLGERGGECAQAGAAPGELQPGTGRKSKGNLQLWGSCFPSGRWQELWGADKEQRPCVGEVIFSIISLLWFNSENKILREALALVPIKRSLVSQVHPKTLTCQL